MPDAAGGAALVVLISGRGSNLQALLDAVADGSLPARVCCVVSNQADAPGLARADAAGVPTRTVAHRDFARRADFDAALARCIDEFEPDLVILAGFMRVLGRDFVLHYAGRLINIHPSLLPDFPGLDTHARVLRAGVREHGASVHFVTPELDGGPVIAQARVAVQPGDDAEQLAARVLEREHRLLPRTVSWIVQGRVRLAGRQVLFDGEPLNAPLQVMD